MYVYYVAEAQVSECTYSIQECQVKDHSSAQLKPLLALLCCCSQAPRQDLTLIHIMYAHCIRTYVPITYLRIYRHPFWK